MLTAEQKQAIAVKSLPYTLTDELRVMTLIDQTERVILRCVPGDLVECGVWRGGSMMAIALTLIELGVTDHNLWLYDTFEGMSAPEPVDVDFTGAPAQPVFDQHKIADDRSSWCGVGINLVRAWVEGTGYPPERIRYVVGKVEDTLPGETPERIALLHLDTDFYSSTKHELIHLYPRVQPGGALVIDDYGHWRGCKKAVDEYLAANAPAQSVVACGYSAVILEKQ